MKSIIKNQIVTALLFSITVLNAQSQSMNERPRNSKDIISVEFLKNIEFLGFVLHIGDTEADYSQTFTNHPLRLFLDKKREQLRNEESISRVFELGEELSYSLFVELFTKMDELPHNDGYEIPSQLLQKYSLNTSADISLMQEIMEQVYIFYEQSEFELFWKTHQEWYKGALKEINEIKPDHVLIDVLENFYGQQFAKYKIIPSLTFWPGPGFGFEGENIAFFVLGPFNHDLKFNNTERLKTLAIHEFGHAFANHILETSCINIIEETRPLFDPIAESMYSQSYPGWSYSVNEHFVRAGEVLIPEMMNNTSLSESNLLFNTEEKNFIYLPFIVDQLRKYRILEGLSYEESAKKTLEDLKKEFMP